MKMESAFIRLLHGQSFTEPESEKIFSQVFRRRIPESKIKALLLLLAKKGETAAEVRGCLKALQALEKPSKVRVRGLMDTCGTGGDHQNSINVSTLAALVIAGAGGKVAKHGNRGISSRCGSSDLMEALGVHLPAPKARMMQSIQKFGIGYFHAPFHHPVFSRLQSLRKKLKARTILNLLGPLANPLQVPVQLVGVSSPKALRLYAEVLSGIREKTALVCHSRDGLDEISIQAPTDVVKISQGHMIWGRIEPRKLGFRSSTKPAPKIHSVLQSKSLALKLLRNQLAGPARDTVVLNAAAGLWISGKAKGLQEGIQLADHSIRSGKALEALQGLKKISHA